MQFVCRGACPVRGEAAVRPFENQLDHELLEEMRRSEIGWISAPLDVICFTVQVHEVLPSPHFPLDVGMIHPLTRSFLVPAPLPVLPCRTTFRAND